MADRNPWLPLFELIPEKERFLLKVDSNEETISLFIILKFREKDVDLRWN